MQNKVPKTDIMSHDDFSLSAVRTQAQQQFLLTSFRESRVKTNELPRNRRKQCPRRGRNISLDRNVVRWHPLQVVMFTPESKRRTVNIHLPLPISVERTQIMTKIAERTKVEWRSVGGSEVKTCTLVFAYLSANEKSVAI